MTAGAGSQSSEAPTAATSAHATPARKPRFALFIATVAGLGYIPKAPGTFGSLAGILLALLPFWGSIAALMAVFASMHTPELGRMSFVSFRVVSHIDPILFGQCLLATFVAAIGVWSAGRAATFWTQKDPQRVVIDEVSGQHLALLLGCALPVSKAMESFSSDATSYSWPFSTFGLATVHSVLSWKYLLLGFILFRVFDIWKPFPARQAESLPGGWGIMADDWVAGIYAAIGLWIARAAGL
jgi:phosphatidylglycerophosphatase A